MKGLTLGLTIAAAVTVTVAIILGVVFTVLWQRMDTSGTSRIQERFPTEQILRSETTANFFGLQSRGRGQIRGNGALVLTPNELWFSRFVKRDDIEIPLSQIVAVDLVDSHLGKRIIGQQLLYVEFTTDSQSDTDAIAWAVTDLNGWQNAIQAARP